MLGMSVHQERAVKPGRNTSAMGLCLLAMAGLLVGIGISFLGSKAGRFASSSPPAPSMDPHPAIAVPTTALATLTPPQQVQRVSGPAKTPRIAADSARARGAPNPGREDFTQSVPSQIGADDANDDATAPPKEPPTSAAPAPAPEAVIAKATRPVSAPTLTTPVPFKNWTQLRYTTSKMIILTGEVKITRAVVGDTVTMRTETQARLFGASFVNAWSLASRDRRTGRPLEFLDVRPGKRAERWTFHDQSIVCTVLKPNPKQKNAPIEAWKVTKVRTFPIEDTASASRAAPRSDASSAGAPSHTAVMGVSLPGPGADAHPKATDPTRWVYDYMTLVSSLGDFPLTKIGDETTALVSTSSGPVRVTLRVVQERTIHRTLTDLSTAKPRGVDLRELRLRVRPPAGSPAEKEDYLRGDTELWVEATTRTFTQLSGKFSGVPGRIDLVLAGYR